MLTLGLALTAPGIARPPLPLTLITPATVITATTVIQGA